MKQNAEVKRVANVEARILLLRGHRVMLSTHLAELYGVEPKVLVQAVKRNAARFPGDFMFQLSRDEFANLKSQIVTSSWGGLRRAAPYAFTEQGVAMLSSVLKSPKAIRVNVEIMRAFVRLRRLLASHEDLARKLEERVQRLIIQNPLRTDFQKHYEMIVAEYNSEKDRPTIEKTFEQLLKFIQELDEEATRAIREGLDEESLAIFDLLKKPVLTANETERIKDVAVELLKTLKEEKLKIDHWREKESTRDAVRLTIRDFLWSDATGLPLAAYTESDVHLKTDEVFRHIFRVYPTLPSPYYGPPPQMPPSKRAAWTAYGHPGM